MLTETELKWVKETRHLCNRCEWNLYDNPCVRYGRLGMGERCPGFSPRNLEHDYRDAAEFEARVAVYLAKSPCLTCPDNPRNCPRENTPEKGRPFLEACRMKHARIAVEQEMEQEALCLKS